MLQDEFGTSNPIGSSRHVGKILGCYYQAIHDKILASKRAGIETMALLEDCDIKKFGLKASLEVGQYDALEKGNYTEKAKKSDI